MAPKTKARSSYQRFVNCRDSVVLSLGQNKAAHGISVMSTNVHEHNAAVMLVYAGQKKPIKTDSVALWGHLLGKKKRVVEEKQYVLFHQEAVVKDFEGKTQAQIEQHIRKMLKVLPSANENNEHTGKQGNLLKVGNEQSSNPESNSQASEKGIKRLKNAKLVNTEVEAAAQLLLQVSQEESLKVVHEEMFAAVNTFVGNEQMPNISAVVATLCHELVGEIASEMVTQQWIDAEFKVLLGDIASRVVFPIIGELLHDIACDALFEVDQFDNFDSPIADRSFYHDDVKAQFPISESPHQLAIDLQSHSICGGEWNYTENYPTSSGTPQFGNYSSPTLIPRDKPSALLNTAVSCEQDFATYFQRHYWVKVWNTPKYKLLQMVRREVS